MRSCAKIINRLSGGCIDPGMPNKSKITVRSEHTHLTPINKSRRRTVQLIYGYVVIIEIQLLNTIDALAHGSYSSVYWIRVMFGNHV